MIYAICNEKGGTAKSTTAAAIAAGARHRGKKSLLIDLDPQGNLTYTMRGNSLDAGAYELLTGKATATEVIQHTAQGDLIASGAYLSTSDTTLKGEARTDALKEAIKPIRRRYDVIVIDTQPSLTTNVINALVAADKVIIPLQADLFCLQGLSMLIQNIREAQKQYNKRLKIAGILFTRYSARTLIAREYTEGIKEQAAAQKVPIFKTTIREGVAVKEAQALRESLFDYAPRSNPARDYSDFLDELGI